MKRKAIIISVKGYKLTLQEKKLIKKELPWGLILFKRNIKNLNQLKSLVKDIKRSANHPNFPIMIDEEGGAVTRLSKIIRQNVTQKYFGDLYSIDNKIGKLVYNNYIDKISLILKEIGININTVPVLDVLRKNTNKIIGNRSFSKNPRVVKKLGQICVNQYQKNSIITVIKHIPGHGCATLDSHLATPKVNLSIKDLNKNDFYPFKKNKSLLAMTAHVLYKNLDKENVATFSSKIINQIIRKQIGYKGILISDDISMKALKYDIVTNALKAIRSGCNLVLYCSGVYKENNKLLKKVPFIDSFTKKKTTEIYNVLR